RKNSRSIETVSGVTNLFANGRPLAMMVGEEVVLGVPATVATLVSAALLVPAAVLCVESLSALLPATAEPRREPRPFKLAVLMPAHDEELGIAGTVRALSAELAPGDRLLVVADNCSDRTAELARAAGAEVVERRDAERRGKGHALS